MATARPPWPSSAGRPTSPRPTGDLDARVTAVLGLARGQVYNLTPGLLPVRLHAAYDATTEPAPRARLAASLARCWSYANEPVRARPFALEALNLAEGLDDPPLLADALDAALASHWGPDELAQRRDWAVRLDDAAAHLRDPDARLQAQLWGLTVAWEVLDLPRMHRCMQAIELLGEESPRARFFAASRRLPLELLRRNNGVAPMLIEPGRGGSRPGGDPGRRRGAALHARLLGVLRWQTCRAVRPRQRASRRSRSNTAWPWSAPRRRSSGSVPSGSTRSPRWSARSRPTCSTGFPATTTGCSPSSACSKARSRSRTASWSHRWSATSRRTADARSSTPAR